MAGLWGFTPAGAAETGGLGFAGIKSNRVRVVHYKNLHTIQVIWAQLAL
jgi:hypothetical protein